MKIFRNGVVGKKKEQKKKKLLLITIYFSFINIFEWYNTKQNKKRKNKDKVITYNYLFLIFMISKANADGCLHRCIEAFT